MVNQFKYCLLCGGNLIRKNHDHDEHTRLTCKNCGFILFQNPTPTVLAIIEKEVSEVPKVSEASKARGEILLVKRAIEPYKGYWDLPGGFVEIGQNLETALKQEIKEEIGVEVNSLIYFGSFISNYQANKICEPICCTIFKVTLK